MISEGGFNPEIHHWPTLALDERFNIRSEKEDTPRAHGNVAKCKWYNFLSTKEGRKFKEDNNLDANGIPFASKQESGDAIRAETYSERPITPAEQAKFHKIDLDVYEAGDMKTNYWEVDMKIKVSKVDSEGKTIIVEEPINRPLHQLTVKWVKKKAAIADYEIAAESLRLSFIPKSFISSPPEPGEHRTYIVLPDPHRPYHNKFLWDAALHLIQDIKPYGLVTLGDYLDLRSISGHDVGSTVPVTLWEEYLDGKQGVMELESAGDFKEMTYLCGNHEDRLYRLMKKLEMSKLGQAVVPIEVGLGLEGWNYLNNWKEDYVQIGGLQGIHGLYTGPSGLKKHLERANLIKQDLMYGHSHWWGSMTNEHGTVWNIGTLADIDNLDGFGYVSRFERLKWQNGFALVVVDDENRHFVTPVKCTNKNFFLFGKKY